ncbi:MAG: 4-hydroxybenzoate transporter [Gammaproteobacteria bacterium]|nr:MAG: 4-hydroxybenzoate transporter [Gammaproteobacteria bacterium]
MGNTGNNRVMLTEWIDNAGFGGYQAFVVFLCFLVTVFDGFDTQAIAFTGPAIAASYGVDSTGITPIVTAGVAGMAIGALVFGPLGDRFGRRRAVIWATLAFAGFSLATAWASSVNELILFRFLTGIGMGGATPNVLALASEYSPDKKRGIVMLLATLGLPVGAIMGAQIASVLLADGCCAQYSGLFAGLLPEQFLHETWRLIFVIGGAAPLAFVLLLWLLLPESPHFLAREGKHDRVGKLLRRLKGGAGLAVGSQFQLPEMAQAAGIGALFSPELRRNTFAIWGVYFFNWVAWFAIILWLPSALVTAGLGEAEAANGTKIINGAALLFILPLAWYIPRLPVRGVIVALLVAGVVAMGVLAGAGQQWTLVYVMIGLTGLFVGGPQICLNYLAVTIYPTAVRATGIGWAIGLGRIGTILGAAAGGPLLDQYGVRGFYIAMAVPLVLSAFAAMAVKPVGRNPAAAG